jgi:hypothetical protein
MCWNANVVFGPFVTNNNLSFVRSFDDAAVHARPDNVLW